MCLSGSLVTTLSVHAEVYKWVDEKGRVHYGDKPPANETSIIRSLKSTNQTKTKDKSLTVQNVSRLNNAKLSNSTILRLRKLFDEKQFQKINSLLDTYQRQAEQDTALESSLYVTYSAFDVYDSAYESKFNQWVNATPYFYQPYLARAKYYYSLGWRVRGGKFSRETKSNQFVSMKSYFDKAEKDIRKAISINKKSMVAY